MLEADPLGPQAIITLGHGLPRAHPTGAGPSPHLASRRGIGLRGIGLRGIRPKAGWSSCFAPASPKSRAASCWTSSRGPHELCSWGGDDSADRVHGQQQLSLFHAHHDSRCFLPLPIDEVTTGKPVAVILRPGKTPGGAEVALVLRHLVGAIRKHWPRIEILICGDSHYSRPEALGWLERHRVGYIFGLAGNQALLREVAPLADANAMARLAGATAKARRYAEFRDAAKTWQVARQVIARVEASAQGTIAGSSSPTSRVRRGGCTRRSTAPAAIGFSRWPGMSAEPTGRKT